MLVKMPEREQEEGKNTHEGKKSSVRRVDSIGQLIIPALGTLIVLSVLIDLASGVFVTAFVMLCIAICVIVLWLKHPKEIARETRALDGRLEPMPESPIEALSRKMKEVTDKRQARQEVLAQIKAKCSNQLITVIPKGGAGWEALKQTKHLLCLVDREVHIYEDDSLALTPLPFATIRDLECRRRLNFDHPCRLNIDQGLVPTF